MFQFVFIWTNRKYGPFIFGRHFSNVNDATKSIRKCYASIQIKNSYTFFCVYKSISLSWPQKCPSRAPPRVMNHSGHERASHYHLHIFINICKKKIVRAGRNWRSGTIKRWLDLPLLPVCRHILHRDYVTTSRVIYHPFFLPFLFSLDILFLSISRTTSFAKGQVLPVKYF